MPSHFDRLRDWLKQEASAQRRQIEGRRREGPGAEKSGESLTDMVVSDKRPGLAGTVLATMIKRKRGSRLPNSQMRVGSTVVVTAQNAEQESCKGVVTLRRQTSVQLSLPFVPEGAAFRVDLAPDEVTVRRQQKAIETAESASGQRVRLRDVLLGAAEPRFSDPAELEFAAQLNPSQQAAVTFALSAEDLAIIHGPPGTGKTTTLVELVAQAVNQGEKVLACAPSNTAVDNLVEKLAEAGQKVVRLGHPARVDRRLVQHTLDSQVSRDDTMEIVRDMQREADGLHRKAGRYTRSRPPPGAKQDMYQEAKRLEADARLLEKTIVDWALDRADVVCATTSLNTGLLGDREFGLAVIDEACQTTEPACWVPLAKAHRLVLAGDHCQLPPTVISEAAARDGFSVSMLERLVGTYGDTVTQRLDVQYRMHEQIMQFSSSQFYEDSLQADASVKTHLLADLAAAEENDMTTTAVHFVDTAGADWDEEEEPGSESRQNPLEAEFILKKVDELVAAGVSAEKMAIITPYSGQVRLLRDLCEHDGLEIGTVDGFQGREKEAVLISCVRSNRDGQIGFLADTRRMNVALTRARRKLFVVGDGATLGGHRFYAELLAYFDSIGACRSIWEEM